jgi:hypothetical protein
MGDATRFYVKPRALKNRARAKRRTSNIELPTSNIEVRKKTTEGENDSTKVATKASTRVQGTSWGRFDDDCNQLRQRVLAYAQVDLRADSGVEPVENGGVGAVGERIGIGGDRFPELVGNVGGIHWDESPSRIGTGGGHDNVGSDDYLQNCIGRWVWAYGSGHS